jgi:hypothetical protein
MVRQAQPICFTDREKKGTKAEKGGEKAEMQKGCETAKTETEKMQETETGRKRVRKCKRRTELGKKKRREMQKRDRK